MMWSCSYCTMSAISGGIMPEIVDIRQRMVTGWRSIRPRHSGTHRYCRLYIMRGQIIENSPEHVREIIWDVVYLLCRKVNMTPDETREILSHLKEEQNMGYMFENMEHMDIQEERRKTQEARLELSQTQAELAVALEELARYKAALEELEREKENDIL